MNTTKSVKGVLKTLEHDFSNVDDRTAKQILAKLWDAVVYLRDHHRASERYLVNRRAQDAMFAILDARELLKGVFFKKKPQALGAAVTLLHAALRRLSELRSLEEEHA